MSITVKSWQELVGRIPTVDEETIRGLPMMFWADTEYFLKRGGAVARSFVDALPREWLEERITFVTRRERLEQGWYPNTPHYHMDGLPPSSEGIHPYREPYDMDMIICTLGDVSRTAFVLGDVELPDLGPDERTFDRWTEEIGRQIAEGKVREQLIEPFALVRFGYGSLHRCTAATRTGYRYFIHATRKAKVPILNSEDVQVQLQLIPRSRCKHNWPQDTPIPRVP